MPANYYLYSVQITSVHKARSQKSVCCLYEPVSLLIWLMNFLPGQTQRSIIHCRQLTIKWGSTVLEITLQLLHYKPEKVILQILQLSFEQLIQSLVYLKIILKSGKVN